jgi:hypothetical protein
MGMLINSYLVGVKELGMNNAEELVMNVSQEELQYLLAMMKVTTIPGLDKAMFNGANSRDLTVALTVVERALLARGFLIPQENGMLKMDEAPFALVGTCAFPTYSLLFRRESSTDVESLFWHGTKHLMVEHSIPLPGIHSFKAFTDPDPFYETVFEWVEIPDRPKSDCPAGQIDLATYQQVKRQASENADSTTLIEALEGVGLERDTAEGLVTALRNAEYTLLLGFSSDNGGAEDFEGMKTMMALVSTEGNFEFSSKGEGEKRVIEVMPLDSSSWKASVQSKIEDFPIGK